MEGLVDRCLLAELDADVAAFWTAALHHGPELCELVREFEPTRPAVEALARSQPDEPLERGFRTLVLNRTRHGGILAPGASFLKAGEDGKGLASRWYPDTIISRIRDIRAHRKQIDFHETDGIELLRESAGASDSVVFADPPYTAGGKRAGRRLYAHYEIDHPQLFKILKDCCNDFLLTYDQSSEIVELARRYGFHTEQFSMRNTRHQQMVELAITRDFVDWRNVSS